MNRTSGGPAVDSYEQMVADRVSAYVTQAHDYIQSTELAKRVAKWHESIGPRCGDHQLNFFLFFSRSLFRSLQLLSSWSRTLEWLFELTRCPYKGQRIA